MRAEQADEGAPRLSPIRQTDTHRLIPTQCGVTGDGVLARIAGDDAHLWDILELDGAPDDRLLAERDLLPGIGLDELVFQVPHQGGINAAFCHAHPLGSRFNGPDRGAWYASFEIETARAEVIFHKTLALVEIDVLHDSVTYDDVLADFAGEFHDIREDPEFVDCLDPKSYVASEALAADLLVDGSLGLVHTSVRRRGGTNMVCFRPAVVGNVRLGSTFRFTWSGTTEPTVTVGGTKVTY